MDALPNGMDIPEPHTPSPLESGRTSPSVSSDEDQLVENHRSSDTKHVRQDNHDKLVAACKTIIECLGEDITREGLVNTPTRMASALKFFTSGYDSSLKRAS